jgi:hypothetical protein
MPITTNAAVGSSRSVTTFIDWGNGEWQVEFSELLSMTRPIQPQYAFPSLNCKNQHGTQADWLGGGE